MSCSLKQRSKDLSLFHRGSDSDFVISTHLMADSFACKSHTLMRHSENMVTNLPLKLRAMTHLKNFQEALKVPKQCLDLCKLDE